MGTSGERLRGTLEPVAQSPVDLIVRLKPAGFPSCRSDERHLQEAVASGRLRVLFSSQVVEVRSRTVMLRVGETPQELENDYVWVFIGGTSPTAFLQRLGIQVGPHDLTSEAAREAQLAAS